MADILSGAAGGVLAGIVIGIWFRLHCRRRGIRPDPRWRTLNGGGIYRAD